MNNRKFCRVGLFIRFSCVLGFCVIVGIFSYVRFLQEKSIFLPSTELIASPLDYNIPFEDIYIQSQDNVRIHAWFIESSRSTQEVLLFLHGNTGNISMRMRDIKLFYEQLGVDILIVDYRGYGQSQGKPSEEGVYQDAIASYDYLVSQKGYEGKNIVVYGQSLGGAVAVDLASKREVGYLIVDSSFSNLQDVARIRYPFLPVFFMSIKMDSLKKIRGIQSPKLILHNPEDTVVPFVLGVKLYEQAMDPKEFMRVGGVHKKLSRDQENQFISGIRRFIKKDFALKGIK